MCVGVGGGGSSRLGEGGGEVAGYIRGTSPGTRDMQRLNHRTPHSTSQPSPVSAAACVNSRRV